VKKLLETVTAILAIGGLMLVGQSWSQQDPVDDQVAGPRSAVEPGQKDSRSGKWGGFKKFKRSDIEESGSAKTGRTIEELLIQLGETQEKKGTIVSQSGLKSSTTTETPEAPEEAKKRAEIMKQLEAAVAAGFDEDMQVREGELSKLEERLNKLRAQLDRRQKAKGEIIQLEVKVLVNEAEGLGFVGVPSPWSRKGMILGPQTDTPFIKRPITNGKVPMPMNLGPDFKRDEFVPRRPGISPTYKEEPPEYKEKGK
jgi:polyhydroxyalkanoate synthesis regulator phasin